MDNYTIYWDEITTWKAKIKAKTEDEAMDLFRDGQFSGQKIHDSEMYNDQAEVIGPSGQNLRNIHED